MLATQTQLDTTASTCLSQATLSHFPMFILYILGLIFWIWMLVDCIQRRMDGTQKIIWVLVIIFLNVLGAIIYFFAGRNSRIV